MLSVASLLNPVRPEPRGTRLPSNPLSSCASSTTRDSSQLSTQSSTKKPKMTKDGAVFTKGKIKGEVNYPPFEKLSEEAMREVQKFQVHPIGKIKDYCRHIPYNSEKKSFLEKTGRESFEVFQYTFKVPGDEKEYCVMWDYNIGLVRITPFFKCCKYSKTTPAKMLNMNPGLKEITHSITGGALAAQGYWMPFTCALEVCTTFCSHIAPALIPIFGPTFPSQCVRIEAPEHGRMIIDPQTVREATAQAEAYRVRYSTYPSSSSSKSSSRESYSPQNPIRHVAHSHNQHETGSYSTQTLGRRLRLKRAFRGESPYETTTDTDVGDISSGEGGYFHSNSPVAPVSSGLASRLRNWDHAHNSNQNHKSNASIDISPLSHYKGPNPLLSAIPRSTGVVDMQMALSNNNNGGRWHVHNMHVKTPPIDPHVYAKSHNSKRRITTLYVDEEYDGGEESGSVTGTDDRISVDGSKTSELDHHIGERDREDISMTGSADGDASGIGGGATSIVGSSGSGVGCVEKKAAWLLMKLSVKDGESGIVGGISNSGAGGPSGFESVRDKEGFGFDAGLGLGIGLNGGLGAVTAGSGIGSGIGFVAKEDGPRIKRRRATSM